MTDLGSLSAWVSGLVEARRSNEGESVGEGSVVDIALDANGNRHHARSEVTCWRKPSMLAVETRAPGVLTLDRVTLAPCREGTVLSVHAELMLGLRFVDRFVTARVLGVADGDAVVRAAYERSVDALVGLVEALNLGPYR